MNVLYVYADEEKEWNCSEWRCVIPAKGINILTGHSAKLVSVKEFTRKQVRNLIPWADIVIIQRLIFGNILLEILHWKSEGKIIVVDLDDGYHKMPETCAAFKFWRKGLVKKANSEEWVKLPETPFDALVRSIKLIDGVTSPSEVILNDWKNITQTYLVPNYINLDIYKVERETHTGDLTIGWGGSATHYESFTRSGVLKALQKVISNHPGTRLIIAGDSRIYNLFSLQRNRITLEQQKPFNEWPKILVNFDIGIAPLAGEYDERRSWIKVLEYLAMGIPWVASDFAPYHDFSCVGKLTKNISNNWEEALEEVIVNYPKYKEEANKNKAIAQALSIETNAESIIETYYKIIRNANKIE